MKSVEEIKNAIEFNKELIRCDLSHYYTLIGNNSHIWSRLKNTWANPEEFVDTLYWMRFIKKYNRSEIRLITDSTNFTKYYLFFGWKFDGKTIEEYENERTLIINNLLSIKNSYDKNSTIFDTHEFKEIRKNAIGNHSSKAMQLLRKYASSEEELIKIFYYYIYIKDLSASEIAQIYDVSNRSIEKIVVKLNMKQSLSHIQSKAAKTRDYVSAINTAKKTRLSTIKQTGAWGSNTEMLFRTNIESELSNQLDLNRFNFVVGISTHSIVPPLEVDIPIIVFDNINNLTYKFAIEINGEFWHKNRFEKDLKKKQLLLDKGWIHIDCHVDYHFNTIENYYFKSDLEEILNVIQDKLQ